MQLVVLLGSLKALTMVIGTSCDVSPGRAGTDDHDKWFAGQTEAGHGVECHLSPRLAGDYMARAKSTSTC